VALAFPRLAIDEIGQSAEGDGRRERLSHVDVDELGHIFPVDPRINHMQRTRIIARTEEVYLPVHRTRPNEKRAHKEIER
jgi:hypothetical protein